MTGRSRGSGTRRRGRLDGGGGRGLIGWKAEAAAAAIASYDGGGGSSNCKIASLCSASPIFVSCGAIRFLVEQ